MEAEATIPHLADDYVSDFDLDHLEEVVKQEMEARVKLNAAACLSSLAPNLRSPVVTSSGGSDPGPVSSSNPAVQCNAADYLPSSTSSSVAGDGTAPAVGKGAVAASAPHSALQQGMPLTPRTPGTPPDTPPVSTLANLPSSYGGGGGPHVNPHGPEQAAKSVAGNSSLLEDMMWLSQNLRCNGLTHVEPLDLHVRNHEGGPDGDPDWGANGQHHLLRKDFAPSQDGSPEPHLHNLQSPTSTTTTLPMDISALSPVHANHPQGHHPQGHPQGNPQGHHQLQQRLLMGQMPHIPHLHLATSAHHHHPHHDPLDDESLPPLGHEHDLLPHHHHHHHHHHRSGSLADDLLDDDQLMSLTVRELNKRLHGFPREEVVRLKQKRRTLKNRGYAQNCRSKRLQQRHELEGQNRVLQSEMLRLRQELARTMQERDAYKQRYEMLRGQRDGGSQGSMSSVNSSAGGHSNPSSPEYYM